MRWVVSIFCTFLVGIAPACAAPAQLHNKTVSVRWSVQSMVRDPDGKQHGGGSNISYTVYISSAGRLFERTTRTTGNQRSTQDNDPSVASTKMGEARGLRFVGNDLVINRDYSGGGGSGAMRALVSFDPSYASCNVKVTHGAEAGGMIKRRSLDGVVREMISMTVTNQSCSIHDGNAFAN